MKKKRRLLSALLASTLLLASIGFEASAKTTPLG